MSNNLQLSKPFLISYQWHLDSYIQFVLHDMETYWLKFILSCNSHVEPIVQFSGQVGHIDRLRNISFISLSF